MKSIVLGMTAALLATATGAACAESCIGLEELTAKETGTKAVFLSQIRAAGTGEVANATAEAVPCSSLLTVLDKIVNGSRSGGRKLEENKPFDPAAAQANFDKALELPEVKAQLDDLAHTIEDEDVRMLYEAAVLDAEGFYDARELLVQKLRAKLGG